MNTGHRQRVRSRRSVFWALPLLLLGGCLEKPALRVGDIRTVTLHASGRSWEASQSGVTALVEAYHRAEVRHDDFGTTPPAGADVLLKNGEVMRFWGGSEGIQGLWFRGKDIDLRGQDLGDLLAAVVAQAEQGGAANGSQPARSETNSTSGAAGSRR
jgi:hypothetical protein